MSLPVVGGGHEPPPVGGIIISALHCWPQDTKDAMSPVLQSFSLDMNLGQVIPTFLETLNASSLVVSQLTLLASRTNVITTTNSHMFGLDSGTAISGWEGPIIRDSNQQNKCAVVLQLHTYTRHGEYASWSFDLDMNSLLLS